MIYSGANVKVCRERRLINHESKRRLINHKNKRRERVGGNIFDSIRNWFVKTAIKTTPIPLLQKGLKPRVLNKKTSEWEKANSLPRTVSKYAGVPD